MQFPESDCFVKYTTFQMQGHRNRRQIRNINNILVLFKYLYISKMNMLRSLIPSPSRSNMFLSLRIYPLSHIITEAHNKDTGVQLNQANLIQFNGKLISLRLWMQFFLDVGLKWNTVEWAKSNKTWAPKLGRSTGTVTNYLFALINLYDKMFTRIYIIVPKSI